MPGTVGFGYGVRPGAEAGTRAGIDKKRRIPIRSDGAVDVFADTL